MSLTYLLLAAAAPVQLGSIPPMCRDVAPQMVQGGRETRPKRLGELPPAEAYLAVMRTENGCIRPVKVREARALRR